MEGPFLRLRIPSVPPTIIKINTTDPQIIPLVWSGLSKNSAGMGDGVVVGMSVADWRMAAPEAGSGQANMINKRIAISKRIHNTSCRRVKKEGLGFNGITPIYLRGDTDNRSAAA